MTDNLLAASMPIPSEAPAPPVSTENARTPLPQPPTAEGHAGGEEQAGPSGLQTAEPIELDGVSIPEGVDPSFLDALPEDIR